MIKYFEDNMKILEDSINSLDEKVWQQVVGECSQCLNNGGQIIASGLGKNVPICEKFVGTLNSFGIRANFLHTNTAIHGDLGIVRPNDVVFLLSKSGNTQESIVLADYLIERGANVWLLSCNENSTLAMMLEKRVILQLEHEGDLWNIAPNNSTTVFLIFLQGLAVELSKQQNIPLTQFKSNHPGGAIGKKLQQINNEETKNFKMSDINKCWIFDLDGTLVEHNSYLTKGTDVLLPGVKEHINNLPKDDMIIIITARESKYKDQTLKFLSDNDIRYDKIIFDAPKGERIVINDCKPDGLKCAYAINIERDKFCKINVTRDVKKQGE